MELKDYLRVYWSQRRFIIGVMVVAIGGSLTVAAMQPVSYTVSESLAINRINKATTNQYEYDGYYALQAADIFSQTVVSWFRTPSILHEIYDRAKLNPEIKSVDSLPSRFSVKKYSAQNIVVRFSERTADRAAAVAAAIPIVLADKTNQLNQTTDGKSLFAISGTTPVIAPSRPHLGLVGVATAVVSFGLGLFLAAARYWLRT